jgi:putative membrane protein
MNLVVSHWSANVAVLAAALAVVAVHLAGLLGLRADARRSGAALRSGAAPPGAGLPGAGLPAAGLPAGVAREAIAFYSGLLLLVLAVVSPLGYWAGTFIWLRVLQDIVFGVYAPPLIVLGAPWLVLWRGLGRGPGSGPGHTWSPRATTATGRVPPSLRSWPVAVTALFVVVWCGWYVPALYDAGVHHPVVLALQAVTTLAAGTALWLQLIGSRPYSPQFGPLYRVMLLAAIVLCSTILGMVLSFGANVLYPVYLGVGHHHLLSVVFDQQAGGSELWVLVLVPYLIAGIALLVRWLNEEESQALSLGLDRMLRAPKSTWPTRTGSR